MKCERLHATISVNQCLSNQKPNPADYKAWKGLSQKRPQCPTCWKCPTGEAAKRGELKDDDVKELLQHKDSISQPAIVASENDTSKSPQQAPLAAQTAKDGGTDQVKIHCARCKRSWPREDAHLFFYNDKKSKKGFGSWCRECLKERDREIQKAILERRRKKAEATGDMYMKQKDVSLDDTIDDIIKEDRNKHATDKRGEENMGIGRPTHITQEMKKKAKEHANFAMQQRHEPQADTSLDQSTDVSFDQSTDVLVDQSNGVLLTREERHELMKPAPSKPITDWNPGNFNSVIMVDLTAYPEIYDKILNIARDEDRTPEGQVRHWIRKHLNGMREVTNA